MELKFLGRGASLNPKEGNNSAYFIENNQIFLIDCGENIFERLIQKNLLKHIEAINIMITHTHSDHIGSLGSLITYSFYTLQKPLNIILPRNAKHFSNIEKIVSGFGCTKLMYHYVVEKSFDGQYETFDTIRYIETEHCDELDSYGLLFTTKKGIVYYSGDTREVETIKKLIANQPIDKLYIDTTKIWFKYKPYDWTYYVDVFNNEIIDSDISLSKNCNNPLNHKLAVEEMLKTKIKRGYKNLDTIFHSDQGSIYSSLAFNNALKDYTIIRSMSRIGTPTDNPIIESLNGWLKKEIFIDFNVNNYENVQDFINDVIYDYNNFRPAYTLNYKTPIQYRTELGY